MNQYCWMLLFICAIQIFITQALTQTQTDNKDLKRRLTSVWGKRGLEKRLSNTWGKRGGVEDDVVTPDELYEQYMRRILQARQQQHIQPDSDLDPIAYYRLLNHVQHRNQEEDNDNNMDFDEMKNMS